MDALKHDHQEIPRVEGDLRIYWDAEDGRITQAWCQGTMYRGYEMILVGRFPEDALATTARLCGICSTSHVVAATDALEDAWKITPPAQAVRLRNLFLAAESTMSDVRQGVLFFGPGLCHPAFSRHLLYDQIMATFQAPMLGWLPRQVRDASKRVLGVITAFTRQWPHSVPFRPGGATCPVGIEQIKRARAAVEDFATWYAPTILGGSLEQWEQVATHDQFWEWVEGHPAGVLSLYARYAVGAVGLDQVGHGTPTLLSAGLYRDPLVPRRPLVPGAVSRDGRLDSLDHNMVREHTRFSWFADVGPRHPWDVMVKPDVSRPESYSWATAPRYGDSVVQLGPLPEALLAGDPLLTSLTRVEGTSAHLRQLARWIRPARSIVLMRGWLAELETDVGTPVLEVPEALDGDAQGFGHTNATRGTLMHWVRLKAGRIETYQVITPTTWNASPRDDQGTAGHFEQSLVGLPADDASQGIRSLVIGSHDPCLVCTTQ